MKSLRLSRPQLNPIIVRELRTRMRGIRPYAILTLFLVLLVGAGYGIYWLMLQQSRMGSTVMSAQIGQALFNGLMLCELLMVVFLAPAMTSGAISSERELLTYDMLMATPLPAARILWGKLVAALSYLFLLIVASLPVFSVVLMFGGIDVRQLGKALLLLLATTVTFGAIGLFCSSMLRRTSRATIIAYTVILGVLGTTALAGSLWGVASTPPGQQAPPWVLYMNPFSALLSIAAVVPRSDSVVFFDYSNPFGGLPFVTLIAPNPVYFGQDGPVVVPTFRATLVCYTLLTALACWFSSHLVLPRRRFRPRWGDLAFLLLLAGLLGTAYLFRAWWLVQPPQMPGRA